MAAIQKKPLSKNFSHYVVTQRFHSGVFVNWSSVKKVTEGFTWPIFKGFYTLEEAMEHARKHIGYNFYVEESVPVSLMQANFVMESQVYEEEVKNLSYKNAELTEELAKKIYEADDLQTQLRVKQEDLVQLAMEISESNLKVERYKKKGIPHVNRSFECLAVRLKMPQFTCITLQPLFEACPELEVIIVDKAKKAFYQKIIQLQNFLLYYHMNQWYKGLTITQEYFHYKEQPAGFLKAQINLAHCTLDRDRLIELYDYGMLDYIIFNKPEETYFFGEKIQLVLGNITVSETFKHSFIHFLPKVMD